MTSSRSPGTMTSARGPMRWSMCCGSIAPMEIPPITWSMSGPALSVSPWTPSRTMDRVGLDRMGRYGRTPSSGMPCRARPRSRVRARSGLARRSTLLTMAPATRTPSRSKRAALSTISSMGRPTPPSDTITAGAPSIPATTAFDSPMTAPTPACPVPSMSSISRSCANEAWAATIRAGRSATTLPSMYALVNPRGMWTGLIRAIGSGRSNTVFMRTASSSAETPSWMTVRWPTGLMNPAESPRRRKPSRTPRLIVVLPRFWPVAAR